MAPFFMLSKSMKTLFTLHPEIVVLPVNSQLCQRERGKKASSLILTC